MQLFITSPLPKTIATFYIFRESNALCLHRPIMLQESGQLVFDDENRKGRMRRKERYNAWPCLLPPVGNVFPSLFVSLTTAAPGVPLEAEEQREPPMPSKGNLQSPSAFPVYTASCISHHRPPFVHQWRARVHVHARTHTRDHASPPRTRGGIGRITKRNPVRHLASERQSRSPQDHPAESLSNN